MKENMNISVSKEYQKFLKSIKQNIASARAKAVLSANKELICLYYDIGKKIIEKQKTHKWGSKFIEHLADDLQKLFPDIKGFSRANLFYMRAFAEAYPDEKIVQQLAGQIPWFHNVTIFTKVKKYEHRIWYLQKTIEQGWNRTILEHQIDSNAIKRSGKTITNFKNTLPSKQSETAQDLLKDPYFLNFVGIDENIKEKELQKKLIDHIRDFLLELGKGFAFVGSEYHIEVGGQDFYIDLLFYHIVLKSYVVVELKTGDFKPEYTGKLNFYLSAVDKQLKGKDDNPTIGILLCKNRNKVIVEYSLQNIDKPVGVAEYKIGIKKSKSKITQLLPLNELQSEVNKHSKKTK